MFEDYLMPVKDKLGFAKYIPENLIKIVTMHVFIGKTFMQLWTSQQIINLFVEMWALPTAANEEKPFNDNFVKKEIRNLNER